MENLILNKINRDEILKKVIKNIPQDADIYLVGGYLRDALMNIESFDRDIIVNNISPYDFASIIGNIFKIKPILLDKENQIYRLVLQNKKDFFDVTKINGESLADDLKSRDLTINSLAINLKTFEIVDKCGSLNDFNNKILKTYDVKNMLSDPLRMLRVFRFASKLGFKTDKTLLNFINKNANKINRVSKERIIYEMLKFFEGKYSNIAFLDLQYNKILNELFPFVDELKKVPPNLHHHLCLFHHSIETSNKIQEFYDTSSDKIKSHFDKTFANNISRLAHIKLAGFLHDIGKPSTWVIEENTQRHRFIKHDEVGSELVVPYLTRLKFPKKTRKYIKKMIKHHIYPSSLMSSSDVSKKAINRFYRKMDEDTLDVIILAKADRTSALGVEITKETVENNLRNLTKLENGWFEFCQNNKEIPKLINGLEIMELLKLKSPKSLSNIIKTLHNAQYDGVVKTKKEAKEFLLNNFDNNSVEQI